MCIRDRPGRALDLRGPARYGLDLAMEAIRQGPLRRLAELADRDFPSLFAARERSVGGLEKRRDDLGKLSHDAGASIVLMGSCCLLYTSDAADDLTRVDLGG